ncbi:Mpt5p PWA37_000358 [Arxiozyma heterogenica]|uniref:Mpt5p n=1 Tax=Arxiozyma heterogenica TaxID=278026 RepID=UPI002F01BADB
MSFNNTSIAPTISSSSATAATVASNSNNQIQHHYHHHQPQLSVNSISSIVEPITPPPISQMNIKRNDHQKARSLDLTGLGQYITTTQSPIMLGKLNHNNNSNSSQSYNIHHHYSNNNNNNSDLISPNEIINTPLEKLNYLKLATDQFGCRFLQKKLESNSDVESDLVRDLMFEQIKGSFLNLILDPFGNYLIQKLCEFLTTAQKTFLIESIYPYVFKISINQYGTRSLQKIIDTVDNEQQIDLIIRGFSQEFTSIEQVVTLINDLNGNHVIQKCIFKFPSTKFGFIIDTIIEKDNIITISTHKHGCCVLQKLLNVCTLQQICTISWKIIQYLSGLINDQFGNYIIQFLLAIKELDYYLLNEMFNKLHNELIQLSCLKFSSNVIEKFIKKLFHIIKSSIKGGFLPNVNDNVINETMNILLTIIDSFTLNLNILIRDNYGNYALQTLLDVKNYDIMLNYPDNLLIMENNKKYLSFSNDFTNKISNLILLTKDLLPSIKTTSYAKKIKLKVRAFVELTGIASNDPKNNSVYGNNGNITPNLPSIINPVLPATVTSPSSVISATMKNNNGFNRTKLQSNDTSYKTKQHQRHVSLPANAYHRRNSSVASSNSSVYINDNRLNVNSNISSTQTLHNNMLNLFNPQATSPLNYQKQFNNTLSVPFSSLSINNINNANNSTNTVNNNIGQRFVTPQLHQPSSILLNDVNDTTNTSAVNSTANLCQQNTFASNGYIVNTNNSNNNNSNNNTNLNSTINNFSVNDVMSTPNTHLRYPNSVFTSPNLFTNSTSSDLSFLTPQPQRVVSNPYPQQNFHNTFNSDNKISMNDTSLMFLGDDEFKNFNVNTRY